MAWAKNGTPDTLTSASAEASITDLTANVFNEFMCHSYSATSAGTLWKRQFNSDTSSVYANRYSANGGGDGTATSQAMINMGNNTNYDHFQLIYQSAIVGKEKLGIEFIVEAGVAGAGNAPNRRENVSKYVPSPDATITGIQMGSSGTAGISSNLSALGSDMTPAAAAPFPSDVQVGSRAEITDIRKMYHYTDPLTRSHDFTSATGWTTTDSARVNVDATTNDRLDFDTTTTSNLATLAFDHGSTLSDTAFVNRFKLVISAVTTETGGSAGKVAIGFSDSSQTQGMSTAQDFIGLLIDTQSSTNRIVTDSVNESTPHTGTVFTNQFSATTYYVEIIRNSATNVSWTLYNNSDFTDVFETKTLTSVSSSLISLQYFKVMTWTTGTITGNITGYVDDWQLYNGVTDIDKYWSEEGT